MASKYTVRRGFWTEDAAKLNTKTGKPVKRFVADASGDVAFLSNGSWSGSLTVKLDDVEAIEAVAALAVALIHGEYPSAEPCGKVATMGGSMYACVRDAGHGDACDMVAVQGAPVKAPTPPTPPTVTRTTDTVPASKVPPAIAAKPTVDMSQLRSLFPAKHAK